MLIPKSRDVTLSADPTLEFIHKLWLDISHSSLCSMGFPGGSDCNESTCNAGDLHAIPALGRSPGKGNGNPLQYSCLENSMDKGALRAIVHRVAKSQIRLRD